MNNYYISFGSDHAHRVDGFTYDRNVLMGIKAETEGDARVVAFALFGPKFCTSYDENRVTLKNYPNGVRFLNQSTVDAYLKRPTE